MTAGGIDMREQFDMLRRGLHIAVATPGRLKDLLGKRKMNLDTCLYLCLDEADRMVDSTGFEEEVREVQHPNRLLYSDQPPSCSLYGALMLNDLSHCNSQQRR